MKASLVVVLGTFFGPTGVGGVEANIMVCEATDVLPCTQSNCCTPIRMSVGTKIKYRCIVESGCPFNVNTTQSNTIAPPVTPGPSTTPVTPGPTATPVTPGPTATPVTPGPTTTPVTLGPTATPVTPGPTTPSVTLSPTMMPSAAPSAKVNIAFLKPAHQSSDFDWADEPLVDVDFEGKYYVTGIKIWNRQDGYQERLDGATVELFHPNATPKVVDTLDTALVYDIVLENNIEATGLRIRHEKEAFLSLTEVEVYGYMSIAKANIAFGKPASQSSDFDWADADWSASVAVDGNKNFQKDDDKASHTMEESNPWWTVDFEGKYYVTGIKIWNRQDGYQERLDG
eukprot:CAMPEP_0172518344 /NCGR_PEP_ID=MMETSP1066-20121228/290764_1 /TAXON_ID=671091 /ORGANISM="Coscinodiscus wailesii, Strain CCMP2513" /LENGTH=341 /DNA_ID=CAMNT_0013300715 /DNA_START=169 /DNA_END=1191 /DNA_ORIENTATION=-